MSYESVLISIHAPQWGATYALGVPFEHVVISIHAPQWGATCHSHLSAENIKHFNPRTPVGCDLLGFFSLGFPKAFQSTHPSGVRHMTNNTPDTQLEISIHAPQWGATRFAQQQRRILGFQSTHPSGVRLGGNGEIHQYVSISIHAPQWGATHSQRAAIIDDAISIHAPQWGATCMMLKRSDDMTQFQSTHPSGVRRLWPEWRTRPVIFQSTHPSGVRRQDGAHNVNKQRFQSTHPSGVRLPSAPTSTPRRTHFNPRTPVGCDQPSFLTVR